jgi:hypothetical protein
MAPKNALPDTCRSSDGVDEAEHNGGKSKNDYTRNVIVSAALANPSSSHEASAVTLEGMLSLKPADAIETALSAQILTANDAALELYRRAWKPDLSFEVRAKYLALADRAARTVAILSDALHRRQGGGQQQIVVKHIAVNADQAIVTDQVVTGRYGGGEGR